MTSHVNGICAERVGEMHEYLKMCTSLDGLKQKRSQSLWEMENMLIRAKEKLKGLLDKDEELLIKDLESGDVKLITLVKQIDDMHHKYHEKIDVAIKQESRINEIRESRLKADDINEALKKSKSIPGFVIDADDEDDSSDKRLSLDEYSIKQKEGGEHNVKGQEIQQTQYVDKLQENMQHWTQGQRERYAKLKQRGYPPYKFFPGETKETRDYFLNEWEKSLQEKQNQESTTDQPDTTTTTEDSSTTV